MSKSKRKEITLEEAKRIVNDYAALKSGVVKNTFSRPSHLAAPPGDVPLCMTLTEYDGWLTIYWRPPVNR